MRGVPTIVLLCLLAASTSARAADRLPATSSRDHFWFVVEQDHPTPRTGLRHAARDMPHEFYSRSLPLTRPPEAMAAWGRQLWLLHPPTDAATGEERFREAFTVQVDYNPALSRWFYRPYDRLRAVPALRAEGRLVGMAGAAGGPLVLLEDERRPSSGGGAATLWQLQGRDWVRLPLPDQLAAGSAAGRLLALETAGDAGQDLLVFAAGAGGRRIAVHRRGPDGRWSAPRDLDVTPADLVAVTRVSDNVLLVLAAGGPDRLLLAYLRPSTLLRLGRIDRPEGLWAIAGLRDGARLVRRTVQGGVVSAAIDAVTGAVGPEHAMEQQPLTGRVLHRPLLIALAITALMLVFLFRPHTRSGEVKLPAAMTVLSPLGRGVAIAVDLGVSAAVVVLALRCDVADLAELPLWSADLAAAVPYLLTAALTVLHGTVSELASGRTLGKFLVGARVVTQTGGRPGPSAVLVRNALKALVLLIPVLAVFALLTPHLQGLGDLLAGTLVVKDRPGRDAADGKDR